MMFIRYVEIINCYIVVARQQNNDEDLVFVSKEFRQKDILNRLLLHLTKAMPHTNFGHYNAFNYENNFFSFYCLIFCFYEFHEIDLGRIPLGSPLNGTTICLIRA